MGQDMKCTKETMRLYAVTDRAWVGEKSLYEQVEEALQNGVTCLQLREKDLDYDSFLEEAKELAKLCKKYKVPFIINDSVEIALQSGADGVHVGQEDMKACDVRRRVGPDMIIGVSAHNIEEAKAAAEAGADYLGLGAVFSTSTKLDVNTMSYDLLQSICHEVNIPTVAIGGIKEDNLNKLSGSGVDGVAVVSAIFASEAPGTAAKRLRKLVDAYLV